MPFCLSVPPSCSEHWLIGYSDIFTDLLAEMLSSLDRINVISPDEWGNF